MRKKITIKNDFHDTSVNLRVVLGQPLTANQIRRAWKKLCGDNDCVCGGRIGERGKQDVEIEYGRDSATINTLGAI